jgi:hypothetical protein
VFELRTRTPALSIGSYRSVPDPKDMCSFERWHPDGMVQAHLNFGEGTREVVLPSGDEILLSTAGTVMEARASRFPLGPYEGVIVAEGRT